jgi:hypothetical protein
MRQNKTDTQNVSTPVPKKTFPNVQSRLNTGMKVPSDVKQNIETKMSKKIESDIQEAEKKVKTATPARRIMTAPVGPVSASTDELDSIYNEEDPIDVSLASRKKGGSLTTVVPDKTAKSGKFFYTLTLKGSPITISETAKLNSAKQAGKTDASGNIVDEKPKADPIDVAMTERVKAGSLASVVRDAKSKQADPETYKLKLKGSAASLAEPKRDPTSVGSAAAAASPSVQSPVKSAPCEIDLELQKRIKAGAITSTVPKTDKSDEEPVFKLRLAGGEAKLREPVKRETPVKAPPCEIELELSKRISEGAITSTISEKREEEPAFKLRLRGNEPTLG